MFSNLRPNSQLYILHKDATPYRNRSSSECITAYTKVSD